MLELAVCIPSPEAPPARLRKAPPKPPKKSGNFGVIAHLKSSPRCLVLLLPGGTPLPRLILETVDRFP